MTTLKSYSVGNMIDSDIAKARHMIFVEQLQLAAAGLSELPKREVVADAKACKLGEWLQGAEEKLAHLALFGSLVDAHEVFHRIAGVYVDTIATHASQQEQSATEMSLREASARVIACIDELGRAEAARALLLSPEASGHRQEVSDLTWDDALTIGVPKIDNHHKVILSTLANLMRNPEESLHSEAAVAALTDLTGLLEQHFAVEEAHMRRLGMRRDDIQSHRAEHNNILAQCAALNIASYTDRSLKIRDVASQIRRWAVSHVLDYDLAIREYVR
jgi:hemerythrin